MILLRIPPLSRGQNLRHNASLPPLLIDLLRDFLRDLLLLLIMVEDPTAVLRARVGSLAVLSCGVVHLVEVFDQSLVGDLLGVEDDLAGFGVYHMNPY